MTSVGPTTDPVDPHQRRRARMLGVVVAVAFLVLTVVCMIIFSSKGLPKDAKEWKRLQERRSAAEAEAAERALAPEPTTVPTPEPTPQPTPQKDATR